MGEQQQSLKLYDYQQSVSAHCLRASDLSNPINCNTQSVIIKSASSLHPFGSVNDTSIDHQIDPKLFELSQSHQPQNFDYNKYVKQYHQNQHIAMESKLQKFQTKSRKRKQNQSNKNIKNCPPKKKQKISATTNSNISSMPIPLIQHKKQNLLTPSPIPPIPNIDCPQIQSIPLMIPKKKKKSKSKKKKRHKKKKHRSSASIEYSTTQQPQAMPPPPQFMPFHPLPLQQQQSAPSMYPPPPIPAPYGYHPMYPPPHISYTHYNPQFYYMHTTYNYAPPPPQTLQQTLNPALIKKQRIDNKSCEVIDLCDEQKNILKTPPMNGMNVASDSSSSSSSSRSSSSSSSS